MSFAEWLYRYLIGEDVARPNSFAFYPTNAASIGAAQTAAMVRSGPWDVMRQPRRQESAVRNEMTSWKALALRR
ncbi:hypothetical protein [Streptomyces sp. NPDC005525]|uniref:hypothetical protein n=1 Tax=Streptomyces sp. NPDC005525 TaxID=3364720 RepID=UPI00369F22D3